MSQIEQLVKGIFSEQLVNSGKRLVPTSTPVKIRLDKNESAFDVSQEIKEEVAKELIHTQWKNYPPPYYNQLEEMIAKYCGVGPQQVVPGAGSANIITSLLNYFAINQGQVTIAHPSFSLYEYHCKTYGIKHQLWNLNSKLEYDITMLPKLKENGIVLFASPNNPVGNVISKDQLEGLLAKYPRTIFVLDEVYSEFCSGDNSILLNRYPNLVLLRSFSKTFSAAGLRIGYMIANEQLAINFRKLIIPFALNILSFNYVKSILSNTPELKRNKETIEYTILERDRVYESLMEFDPGSKKFWIHPSFGNFLLIRFSDTEYYQNICASLEAEGIRVLDVSNIPILGKAIRITIGSADENNSVIQIFKSAL